MKIENMKIIPKEEIDKLIKIMKTNKLDEMTFVKIWHTYQIDAYEGHFDITITNCSDVVEHYVVYDI